ncbi:MAG: hypothetical protein ABI779_16410 [Acidobacteriota bacterium]
MKPIQWLARVPRYLPAIVWGTEIAGGLILKVFFGKLSTTQDLLAFLVGSGILAHYIHLLVEHYRPANLDDLEHAVDRLEPKDGVSLNRENVRKVLKTVVESGGAVEPIVVETVTRLATDGGRGDHEGQQQIDRWLSLLERFDEREINRDFVRQITAMLHDLNVPRQVESIFNLSLQHEVKRMALLAAEHAVEKVDLNTQYLYASGVAEYYETRMRVSSIYATAHDIPSTFYNDHKDYFHRQTPLLTKTIDFLEYSSGEVQNLELIIGNFDGKAGRLRAFIGPPAEKSRIVIIRLKDLLKDLQEENFWVFVQWHAAHHFGLKFFIRDIYADDTDNWYETELDNVTRRTRDQTIDDFIVYGDDCVFGRIYTEPDSQRRVSLGFHYLRQGAAPDNGSVIPRYRDFFRQLWRDRRSRTLTELWDLLGNDAKRLTSRARYEGVLNAYSAAYRIALEQQRQADRASTT